jgi:GNAT superfamily N-acetyltransferase
VTDPTNLSEVRLGPAYAAEAVALSAEAGWNQTIDDWALMLGFGRGFGRRHGRLLVGTAVVLPYPPFAWIAMVLVSRDWQRRGIATDLLRACIDEAEARGLVAGLDATPAGREVYRPLGFEEVYGLTRLRAETVASVSDSAGPVRPLMMADLEAIADFDRKLFGAARGQVLGHLLQRQPARAFVVETAGAISGYVLAREGREATQIGPLSAPDDATACTLAGAALADLNGPVYLDVVDRHTGLLAWLGARGFAPQRPYTRMIMGRAEPYDDAQRQYAIAGPELG